MARILSMSVIVAVLLAITIQQTAALECWNCQSSDEVDLGEVINHGQKECGNPFDAEKLGDAYLQECKLANPFCFERVKEGVIRGCMSFDKLKEFFASCQNPHPAHIVKPDYCGICETDGCNGANQFRPLVFLIGFPVAIAFIFQKLSSLS